MLGLMMTYPLNISQILEHANLIHGDKHVYTLLPSGKLYTYTYAELYHRVNQLANAMTALGICRGDRVATYASNTYQHLELYCAVPLMGAVVHPLNVRLSPNQLSKIVNEADDKLIIVDGQFSEQFAKLLQEIDCKHIVHFNNNSKLTFNDNSIQYEQFITEADSEYGFEIQDENSAMALCYTSGTDGKPKGVLYTHRSMCLHTLAANQADVFGITESDVVMPVVPMFHAMGWGLPYAAMFAGADIVLHGNNIHRIVDLIAETGVTVAAGVPTVWARLYPALQKRKREISSLHRLIVGGEPMPSTLIEGYEKELGIEVRHAWGMTEMSPTGTFCTLRKTHQKLPDTEKWNIKAMQGRPIPGVQIRIVDENSAELPWDGKTIGELQVRSPWTACSYYKTKSSTEHFTKDGWLRTGDLATINKEGYMHIVDRAKAIIRSGGESISPNAIQRGLLTHPQVVEAAVIGVADEKWGERPIAVVVISSDTVENTSEVLKQHLANEFPKFWIPDRFIIVDEIPKTGVEKIDKNAIIKMIATEFNISSKG